MHQPFQVLLVEDNPADADLTIETLQESKLQLQIDVVTDGAEALDYLTRTGRYADAPVPDLVLLDINLPRIDGKEVLQHIRKQPQLKTIPVVILTTSDAADDISRSYEFGANCYVSKPVNLDAFQTIVRSIEKFWFTIVRLP